MDGQRHRIHGQGSSFGTHELIPDPWCPTGWFVAVGGIGQSYVDLADPTRLRFQTMANFGRVVDLRWPQAQPISAIHVGGAGCTLPRYVAATRPGSRQAVFDLDRDLIGLVREHLELDSVPDLDVRIADGRGGIHDAPADSADLVVLDVFRGAAMATELATVEFFRETARVLRTDGLFLTNVADTESLNFARRFVATVDVVYPHVVVLGEARVLVDKRPGNVVAAASREPLPVRELMARAGSPDSGFVCMTGEQLTAVHGPALPMTEAQPWLQESAGELG